VGAAVDGDGAAQSIRFLINGPEAPVAQVGLDARRWQHRTAHAEIFHDPFKLFHRGVGFLQRNEPHALKARAALHVVVVEPIVVRPGHVDGPIAADDFAEGETEGSVKHGGFDADVFQKIDPAVGPHFVKCPRLEIVEVRRMKVIERRKGVKKTMRVVFVAVALRHVVDDRLTIFDDMTVAVDDRVAFKWHGYVSFPSIPRSSRRADFVKTFTRSRGND